MEYEKNLHNEVIDRVEHHKIDGKVTQIILSCGIILYPIYDYATDECFIEAVDINGKDITI
jgi:hypothetical protein